MRRRPLKRSLIAVLVYLVIAAGVGAGHYTNDPYKGNSIAVFSSAGVGLVWPVVVTDVLVERVGNYYGNMGG